VAKRLRNGSDVLEVAPGPGFFAVELAQRGEFHITGLDISQTLVEIACDHARSAGVQVHFQVGDASAMPFADESFDLIYCSAAFKNFSQPVRALDEMYRVLRPGSEAVIQDLRKDVSLDEIDRYVKQSGRSRMDAWLTKWAFRCMLIKRAYTQEQFHRMAAESRFGACQISLGPIGLEARFAKPVRQ
jgi:ubiquinone/menaquinone biosynthesis C-methylase UbiE